MLKFVHTLAQAQKLKTTTPFTSRTANVGGASGGNLSVMVGYHATSKSFASGETTDVGGATGGTLTLNVGTNKTHAIALLAGATEACAA